MPTDGLAPLGRKEQWLPWSGLVNVKQKIDTPWAPMKHVSWRFQNSSTILSASVYSQCVGLWHGIVCQRKLHYEMKLKQANPKNSSFRKICKWVYSCNLIWRIILKRSIMLSAQFVVLYKLCKPKPKCMTLILGEIYLTCWNETLICSSFFCHSPLKRWPLLNFPIKANQTKPLYSRTSL